MFFYCKPEIFGQNNDLKNIKNAKFEYKDSYNFKINKKLCALL